MQMILNFYNFLFINNLYLVKKTSTLLGKKT